MRGWQALNDDSDPPLNMHISLTMVLNDSITLPNCFSSELDYLIHKSLHNSYTKIIILGLVLVINAAQIFMNSNQKLTQIEFIDKFVHDFTQLQKTFDDKTCKLWHAHVVLFVFEQGEEDHKDVGMVAVLQHTQHRRVQVFQNELTFLILTNFIKIFNQKPRQELLSELIDLRLGNLLHDFLRSTSFIHDCDEVFGKSQRNILNRIFEYIIHDMSECFYQLVAAFDKSFLLI